MKSTNERLSPEQVDDPVTSNLKVRYVATRLLHYQLEVRIF